MESAPAIKSKSERRKPLTNDELGAKGETEIARLCADTGLVWNPSTRDRGGWDFIIEFDPQTGESFDKRNAGLSCHTQVKTLWSTSSPRISLKLSVAERLAKEPKPTFVIALVVNDDCSLSHLHLVHFRGPLLERVLKALRKAHLGKSPLHKLNFSFDIKEHPRIEPTGSAFRSAIEDTVGPDFGAYISAKQIEWMESGYTGARYRMTATIRASRTDMAEAFLENRPLEVVKMQHSETRFGITLPVALPSGSVSSTITIEPTPSDQAILRFFPRGSGSAAVFSADVFWAPKEMTGDDFRARLRTAFFKIDLDSSGLAQISSTSDAIANGRHDIGAWKNYFRLLHNLGSDGTRLEVAPATAQSFSLIMQKSADDELSDVGIAVAEMCERAEYILSHAGATSPLLSHSELFQAAPAVNQCYAMLKQHADALFLELAHDDRIQTDPFSIAYANYFRLGDAMFGVGALAGMKLHTDDSDKTWGVDRVEKVRVRLIASNEKAFDLFSNELKEDFETPHLAKAVWEGLEEQANS